MLTRVHNEFCSLFYNTDASPQMSNYSSSSGGVGVIRTGGRGPSGEQAKLDFGDVVGTATVNGREFTGHVIELRDGIVYVDGVPQDIKAEDDAKVVYRTADIRVTGNVVRVQSTSGHIAVDSANNIQTTSGDISVVNSHGTISTVSGDVDVHGNYTCADPPTSIHGRISTVTVLRDAGNPVAAEDTMDISEGNFEMDFADLMERQSYIHADMENGDFESMLEFLSDPDVPVTDRQKWALPYLQDCIDMDKEAVFRKVYDLYTGEKPLDPEFGLRAIDKGRSSMFIMMIRDGKVRLDAGYLPKIAAKGGNWIHTFSTAVLCGCPNRNPDILTAAVGTKEYDFVEELLLAKYPVDEDAVCARIDSSCEYMMGVVMYKTLASNTFKKYADMFLESTQWVPKADRRRNY